MLLAHLLIGISSKNLLEPFSQKLARTVLAKTYPNCPFSIIPQPKLRLSLVQFLILIILCSKQEGGKWKRIYKREVLNLLRKCHPFYNTVNFKEKTIKGTHKVIIYVGKIQSVHTTFDCRKNLSQESSVYCLVAKSDKLRYYSLE